MNKQELLLSLRNSLDLARNLDDQLDVRGINIYAYMTIYNLIINVQRLDVLIDEEYATTEAIDIILGGMFYDVLDNEVRGLWNVISGGRDFIEDEGRFLRYIEERGDDDSGYDNSPSGASSVDSSESNTSNITDPYVFSASDVEMSGMNLGSDL